MIVVWFMNKCSIKCAIKRSSKYEKRVTVTSSGLSSCYCYCGKPCWNPSLPWYSLLYYHFRQNDYSKRYLHWNICSPYLYIQVIVVIATRILFPCASSVICSRFKWFYIVLEMEDFDKKFHTVTHSFNIHTLLSAKKEIFHFRITRKS